MLAEKTDALWQKREPFQNGSKARKEIPDWHQVAAKPKGGFVEFRPLQLLIIWWAFSERLVSPLAVRVFWALVEMQCRRCTRKPGVGAKFSYEELSELVGDIGEGRARRAIRELTKLKLLRLDDGNVLVVQSPDELSGGELSSLWDLIERAGKCVRAHGAPIPVPRRLLRLLAKGEAGFKGRGCLAAVFAVLLRCLFRQKAQGVWACRSGGLLKASWIAEVFEVGVQTAKRELSRLQRLGWVKRLETPHWVQQRHGAKTVINLSWSERAATSNVPNCVPAVPDAVPEEPKKVIPLPAEIEPVLIPPNKNQKLSSPKRIKNQEPASGGRAGVYKSEKRGEEPSLSNVTLADLLATERTVKLYEQSVARRFAEPSERARLFVVAFAEKARRMGKQACAFFAWQVRNHEVAVRYLTDVDEESARRRLLELSRKERGYDRLPAVVEKREERPRLSRDAMVVRDVKRKLRDVPCLWRQLAKVDSTWTRERWVAAEAELKAWTGSWCEEGEEPFRACG